MGRRLVCLVCALPFLLGAEVYRYVDKDGVVTYSEQLPYGVKGERVMSDTPSGGGATQTVRDVGAASAEGTAPATNEKMKLSKEQQAMLDQLKQADDARKAELAKIRQDNCTRSKDVLDRLSTRGRLRVRDETGEERAMPEDERERRIQEAQQGIAQNCDGGA